MALNWDVTMNENAYREISKEEYNNEPKKISLFQCPKYEKDGKYYEMTLECNMLILLCGMIIGIPEITEENYEIIFNRIAILEEINGTYLKHTNPKTKENEAYPFTLEMVKKNIGVKTNGIVLKKFEFQKKVVHDAVNDREI
jgi:hypothetical protein